MTEVRPANGADAGMVAELLCELGYPVTADEVGRRLGSLGSGDRVLVAARDWACSVIEVSSSRRPERDAAHRLYPTAGFVDAWS